MMSRWRDYWDGIKSWQMTLLLFLFVWVVPGVAESGTEADDVSPEIAFADISVFQTSAGYLHEYMIAKYKNSGEDAKARKKEAQRLALVSDIYIKAWSYALWNKVFFFVSLAMAFVVLIWPSLSVIAPKRLGEKPIFKSAVVQTTLTAIAAACFFVYSDYKEKQMSAENLMRYVIHSEDSLSSISNRAIEELMRIDKGLSFLDAVSDIDTLGG